MFKLCCHRIQPPGDTATARSHNGAREEGESAVRVCDKEQKCDKGKKTWEKQEGGQK